MGSQGNDTPQVKIFTEKGNESDVSLSAMLLGSGQINAAALNAAIDLNLFDIIAKATPNAGFVSPSEIASKLPNQNPYTPHRPDRFLRLLVTFSVRTGTMRGSMNSLGLGKYYLRKDDVPPGPH